jgi:hypothetical protein
MLKKIAETRSSAFVSTPVCSDLSFFIDLYTTFFYLYSFTFWIAFRFYMDIFSHFNRLVPEYSKETVCRMTFARTTLSPTVYKLQHCRNVNKPYHHVLLRNILRFFQLSVCQLSVILLNVVATISHFLFIYLFCSFVCSVPATHCYNFFSLSFQIKSS